MSKLQFTARDFAGSTELIDHISWKDAAEVANARLAEMLSEAKVVYGTSSTRGLLPDVWSKSAVAYGVPDTHRALLINIEELKREPCEHEPRMYYKRDANDNFVKSGSAMVRSYEHECLKCGVKLKAKWEESK